MQRLFTRNKHTYISNFKFPKFNHISFSTKFRVEKDTFGDINVPADRYWAAQTQRSLQNFAIGTAEDKMPMSVVHAMAIIKKSAAKVNMRFGLPEDVANSIINASNEVIAGKLDSHFPLVVYQTGSGTQTNMNTNEVISNRGMEIFNANLKSGGKALKIHPNDHVNMSQSSNDTFPTGMHVAIIIDLNRYLLPVLRNIELSFGKKVKEFENIIKIGRTHLQDATPLTLGQEFSGYHTQIKNNISHINENIKYVRQLAQGGTAVGTGLNTKPNFDVLIAAEISKETGLEFETNPNKFEGLAAHDAVCHLSGSLNSLATSLYKIAHDIKILSTDLKELKLDYKGVEVLEEVLNSSVQVMGNHTAVTVSSKFIFYIIFIFLKFKICMVTLN